MALFEYFPNYVWNLSLAITMENGGKIGEIVDMCQPIRDAAARGEDAGTAEFLREWVRMADKLCELAAWLTRAAGAGPNPAVVFCNGLDSCKELLWLGGFPEALSKRGVGCLCVDQPGTGEALRLQDLPATHASERWASPWVDWLQEQPDVAADRVGNTGISLGGHFAPRAVAFEPRFASGAASRTNGRMNPDSLNRP